MLHQRKFFHLEGTTDIGLSIVRKGSCIPALKFLYSKITKVSIILIPHHVVHAFAALSMLFPLPCTSFSPLPICHPDTQRSTPLTLPWVNLFIIQGSAYMPSSLRSLNSPPSILEPSKHSHSSLDCFYFQAMTKNIENTYSCVCSSLKGEMLMKEIIQK